MLPRRVVNPQAVFPRKPVISHGDGNNLVVCGIKEILVHVEDVHRSKCRGQGRCRGGAIGGSGSNGGGIRNSGSGGLGGG